MQSPLCDVEDVGAHALGLRHERVQGLRRTVYDSHDYQEGIRAFKETFGLTDIAGSEFERDLTAYSQSLLDGV